MKKLFVPHNLALLAKEKGFDDQCIGKFKDNNLTLLSYSWNNSELSIHNDGISAPMYQQLIDWFRESYHIIIQIDAHYNPRVSNDSAIFSSWITQTKEEYRKTSNNYYDVLNKAIEEAFKLI